ncbi:MAG: ABC transporter ATP-binding protein [Planctomycetes bacterium]|nr:ABC transporter ATP-binding protein [Planctomycetota bacterium]
MLEVANLRVGFAVDGRVAPVVRGVSFQISQGEVLGLVGESGCGKSVTSMAVMGLLECPPAQVAADAMRLQGMELTAMSAAERRRLRGRAMAMVFQEPMTSLNPVYTIGDQVAEALTVHFPVAPEEAAARALAALKEVHIPSPETVAACYPHELSGGMKQRVMIAMALICRPALIIADEPTTALDVTVQAQILDLLREVRDHNDTGMLFITHDLGVIAEIADRVCVMYAGRVVEEAPTAELLGHPRHPYAAALLRSRPRLTGKRERLYNIAGTVPSPFALPEGCKFAPRCERACPGCAATEPTLREVSPGHRVACHLA